MRRESGGVEGSWRRIGRVNSDGRWDFGPGVQATRGGEGQAFRFALWANVAALGDGNCEGEGEGETTGLLGKGRGRKNQSRCLPTDGFSPVPALAQPKSWPGRWPIGGVSILNRTAWTARSHTLSTVTQPTPTSLSAGHMTPLEVGELATWSKAKIEMRRVIGAVNQ